MFLHPESIIPHFKIAEGMKVADFGSGHGFFAVPIARRVGPYGRVYAIDVVADTLSHLRSEAEGEKLSQIHFIHSDLEKERGSFLSNQSVDRVLLINTLYMLDNKEAALEEARRVLKPKGLFVLIDWKDSFNFLGPHPDHVIALPAALDLVLLQGFKIFKEFNAGDMHYGLVFSLPEAIQV